MGIGYRLQSFDGILLVNMKKRILLVDDSLTVQKVVSLTLDKAEYQVSYARNRVEASRFTVDLSPHLILVSDQVKEINAGSFPKEVETWLGKTHELPAIILITGQDIKEMRHYTAVLRKPFTPQVLHQVVGGYAKLFAHENNLPNEEREILPIPEPRTEKEDFAETRLEQAFNDRFNDESSLMHQTLVSVPEQDDEPTLLNIPTQPLAQKQEAPRESKNLWGVAKNLDSNMKNSELLSVEDSMAFKSALENQVNHALENRDLDAVVDRLLNRIVPPIVERLVQERLDQLMNQQEQMVNER